LFNFFRRNTVPGALSEASDSILEKYSQIDFKIKELSQVYPDRITPLTNSVVSVEKRLGVIPQGQVGASTFTSSSSSAIAMTSSSSSSSTSSSSISAIHNANNNNNNSKGNVTEAAGRDLTNQTLIRGLQGSHVSPLAQLEHHLRTE
jgi:hypothetical protein